MADDCRGSSRTWQPPGASLYFKDSDRQGALLRELYATAVEATVLLPRDPAPTGYLHRSAGDTGRNPDRSQTSPPRAKIDNAAEVSRRRRS